MAVTLNGSVATSAGSASTRTCSHTLASGSNRIVFYIFTVLGSHTISSVTYGGVAMTLLRQNTAAASHIYVYYVLEASLPADGANSATVTFGASEYAGGITFCLQDAVQEAPDYYETDATGAAGSLTIVSPDTDSYLIGGTMWEGIGDVDAATTCSANANSTEIFENFMGPESGMWFGRITTTATGNNTWGYTLNDPMSDHALLGIAVDYQGAVVDTYTPQWVWID